MEQNLKVLIVDDTTTYRSVLKSVINKIPLSDVISTAKDGLDAIEKAKETLPDVVLLDVEMPRMDGLETLAVFKTLFPKLPVIMVSGASRFNATITLQCLEAGAIDFVSKPDSENISDNINSLIESITPLFQHIRNEKKLHLVKATKKPTATILRKGSLNTNIQAISIGISTGGPKALMQLIPQLPKLGVPLFIVIHMPPNFTVSLAERLNQESELKVIEASDNQEVEADTVYIAPGGKHMLVNKVGNSIRIKITESPPVKSCRPSVDVTLESLARTYQEKLLSVIMTGMGNDGENGVKKLKELGGYSLTQSEDSCVVYGMPKAVDEQNLSDEQVHLDSMANKITSLLQEQTKRVSA